MSVVFLGETATPHVFMVFLSPIPPFSPGLSLFQAEPSLFRL
jgi:hypothetical protein